MLFSLRFPMLIMFECDSILFGPAVYGGIHLTLFEYAFRKLAYPPGNIPNDPDDVGLVLLEL